MKSSKDSSEPLILLKCLYSITSISILSACLYDEREPKSSCIVSIAGEKSGLPVISARYFLRNMAARLFGKTKVSLCISEPYFEWKSSATLYRKGVMTNYVKFILYQIQIYNNLSGFEERYYKS